MDEKTLIKSKRVSLKWIFVVIILSVIVIGVISAAFFVMDSLAAKASQEEWDLRYQNVGYENYDEEAHEAAEKAYKEINYIAETLEETCIAVNIPLFSISVILFIVYLSMRHMELVVTDKRAYWRTSFGKRVDLPLDSISAVGTSGKHKIAVSTASGKIAFAGIKNRDDIHKILSDLLIDRQNKAVINEMKNETPKNDIADLKQYKELLDSGVISQEEFDAKKKQLLGL
ncbi:MAG: SHOCT domain-containing protein [Acutalibacteraceae bacterium]